MFVEIRSNLVRAYLSKPPRSLSISLTLFSKARFFFSKSRISSSSRRKSSAVICGCSNVPRCLGSSSLPSLSSSSSLKSPWESFPLFICASCPLCLDTRASKRATDEVSWPCRVRSEVIFSDTPGIGLLRVQRASCLACHRHLLYSTKLLGSFEEKFDVYLTMFSSTLFPLLPTQFPGQ